MSVISNALRQAEKERNRLEPVETPLRRSLLSADLRPLSADNTREGSVPESTAHANGPVGSSLTSIGRNGAWILVIVIGGVVALPWILSKGQVDLGGDLLHSKTTIAGDRVTPIADTTWLTDLPQRVIDEQIDHVEAVSSLPCESIIDSDAAANRYRVTGIMVGTGSRWAVLNGVLVTIGTTVGPASVVGIESDKVRLQLNGCSVDVPLHTVSN